MGVYYICLTGIILYFIPTIRCDNQCSQFEEIQYTLNPGEKRSITVNKNTHYASKSLKWVFLAPGEEYLSVYVTQFNLGTEECVVNGIPDYTSGPLLTLFVYNATGTSRDYPMCPTRPIYQHLLSSNKIEVTYCKGGEGANFSFTVISKIAGIIQAGIAKDVRTIRSSSEIQWIGLTLSPPKLLALQFDDVTVSKGSNGGCKRGFISLTDAKGASLLPKEMPLICSKYGTPQRSYSFVISSAHVNITFRRASFTIQNQLQSISKDPRIVNTITTDETVTGLSYTTYSTNKTAEYEPKPDTKMYQFIGAGIAGLIIVLVVIFVYCKIRKRKVDNKSGRSYSQPQEAVYTSPSTVLSPGEGAISINNVVYEKTIKGKNRMTTQNATSVNHRSVESWLNGNQLSDEDKRLQRLSHLENKYIGLTPRSNPPSFHKSETALMTERPKLAIPTQQNEYEQITNDDLIPPAYLTIHGNEQFMLQNQESMIKNTGRANDFSSLQKNLPTDNEGYLAVTDSQDIFYTPEINTFHEDVKSQNNKHHTISMPNLRDNVLPDHKRSQNCTKMRKKLGNNQRRPSQDIFLKCAYTSGSDLANMKTNSQQMADAMEFNKPENSISCNSINSVLYDSPRPSAMSTDRLYATPCHDSKTSALYDAPRPSLPNIFPGDLRRFQQS